MVGGDGMTIQTETVAAAYQRYARKYDRAVKLYRLLGLRIERYRERAVQHLGLKPGDCVLDLGCGTGLSFRLLMDQIGPEGRLIGVDLSSEMLACAQERVHREGWKNVELFEADIAAYEFPEGLNGVISTGVFGYVSEREHVIEKISHALVPGGRIAIVDGKRPGRWPKWLFRLFVWLSSPFGLTEVYFDGRTWEAVERVFQETTFEEVYGGLLYISSGAAPGEG